MQRLGGARQLAHLGGDAAAARARQLDEHVLKAAGGVMQLAVKLAQTQRGDTQMHDNKDGSLTSLGPSAGASRVDNTRDEFEARSLLC